MWTLKLVTAPAAEPITTALAKTHLRVDHSSDDTLIASLVKAARYEAERITGRALITQTWDWFADEFPYQSLHNSRGEIVLPLPPLQSVTSIVYIAADGVSTTLAASKYAVSESDASGAISPWAPRGRVAPAYGESWPTTRSDIDAVRVRFVAGYGTGGANVPDALLQAMYLLIGAWYTHREEIVMGVSIGSMPAPVAAKALLAGYRTHWQ